MVYEMNKINASYNEHKALQDISCILRPGKWISLIGSSGAGKSTFAKVLKGLIPDFTGEYRIDHHSPSRDKKGMMKIVPEIGYVFQYPEHQLFETTVYRELAFALGVQGYSQQAIRQAIEQILPKVGLNEALLDSAPFQLSGGQKRRVALASVLMLQPRLLILDEPTAGLDPIGRKGLLQMLQQWQRAEDHRTVLFISHHIEDVEEYSDEVIVLHEGRLLGHLDAEELFLNRSDLLTTAGLPLPEPVQLLRLIEELSGQIIPVSSSREQDILQHILPIWQERE
ncbi:ATP-binding cassette domain-containing protein [Paenibacillus massiliensis]|uniref:ATP-binding cassette domain-containing protein n=1 Tax=Paenibacillus massiliensis TaxID=225917 RepID=UPI00040D7C52|nr:ATP-binding cassette domain-containing protein [Paenibacillus massiliensis]